MLAPLLDWRWFISSFVWSVPSASHTHIILAAAWNEALVGGELTAQQKERCDDKEYLASTPGGHLSRSFFRVSRSLIAGHIFAAVALYPSLESSDEALVFLFSAMYSKFESQPARYEQF